MSRKKTPSILFELQQHKRRFWLGLKSFFAEPDTREFALDVVKTFISALGLIATLSAGVGLFFNWQSSEKNTDLAKDRLVTERFSKAIDQLGSDKEEVILGGIYSLERIAKDSAKDQSTIMEVLSAFVRRKSPVAVDKNGRKFLSSNTVTITVQAALTVIGRREKTIYRDLIDLSKVNLGGAELSGANLDSAELSGTNLRRADLSVADLRGAYLDGANLGEANLGSAELNGAKLRGVNLKGANLGGASVKESTLRRAELIGSAVKGRPFILRGSDLSGADLIPEQIVTACNWEQAIFSPGQENKLKLYTTPKSEERPECRIFNSQNQ